MFSRYCIWAVLLLLAAPVAATQAPQATQVAARPSRGYTVFLSGLVVGREDVRVQATAEGVTISGSGRLTGSQDVVMRRVEVRYKPDWTPDAYELEASVNGGETTLFTFFTDGTAVTKGFDGGKPVAHTEKVAPQALVLPNVFFGSYEALTRRLASATPGQEFVAFLGAGIFGSLRLTNAGTERVQIGTSAFTVHRYGLTFTTPRGTVVLNIYADENGSLMRLNIPAQRLDVMRDDLASATARTIVYSNPGDEAVNIPAAGFNLGATLTWPGGAKPAAAVRLPAVILLASAAANDRDGVVGGVPMLGQLAGALADAGFLAVRYDKRGHGQSGGRAEAATLGDHAEDAQAAVRWLGNRRDVDRDRIAVLGHNEGAWTALLAATRERRIAAIVSLAAASSTGAERVVEQQRHVLERMDIPPAERVAKIELQRRINAAVMTGRGWDELPADVRAQADTPWFQGLLTFDTARVIEDVRQPMLFVHGELDAEVPVSHVDRLAELAKTESRSRSVAVVTVRGVNHLFVPAVTGEVSEYATLTDRKVTGDTTKAITEWLSKAFQSAR